jgi:hypothetical protein
VSSATEVNDKIGGPFFSRMNRPIVISKFQAEAEIYTDEHVVELHYTTEDEGCSIIRARFASGARFRLGLCPTSCPTRRPHWEAVG